MKNIFPSYITRQNHGFSLIELMIVIVIIGILTAIAFPSYSSYVVRSKRAAAYSCLTQVNAIMEQVYADAFRYTVDLDDDGSKNFGSSGICSSDGSDCESLKLMLERDGAESINECAEQISSEYNMRFATIHAKKFSLVAEPVSADFDSECRILTLQHNGKASASGPLGEDCFSE